MIIENLETRKVEGRKRVSANITWENNDKPQQEIFFETDNEFAEYIWCNPNAFLVGCIIPAMYNNEKRVHIGEKICPELIEGLETALSWLNYWYYPEGSKIISIEAETSLPPQPTDTSSRAGFFFSSGIDSLATIRENRQYYPVDHPLYLKDGIIIYGQNVESDNRINTFEEALEKLSDVAMDAGIKLIPIYTNLRHLDLNSIFFMKQFHGAILASTAHIFSRKLNNVSISASDDIPTLKFQKTKFFKPYGSHPMLDVQYSSTDLRIRHVGTTLSRFDKIKLLLSWDKGLQNIKVCGPKYPGENCGECEKCIRTQLALLALGVLDKTTAFPLNDISEENLKKVSLEPITDEYSTISHNYLELIPHLSEIGRHDLVRAINYIITRSKYENKTWMKIIKEIDRKYLNGALRKIRNKY